MEHLSRQCFFFSSCFATWEVLGRKFRFFRRILGLGFVNRVLFACFLLIWKLLQLAGLFTLFEGLGTSIFLPTFVGMI